MFTGHVAISWKPNARADKAAYPQVLKSVERQVAGPLEAGVSTVLQSAVHMAAAVASPG